VTQVLCISCHNMILYRCYVLRFLCMSDTVIAVHTYCTLLYSDLPPNTLNLEVTQQVPSRSLRMALSCRNM
jgi:hypothetical protein